MTLPPDDAIRALHEKFAPSSAALDLVYTHCQIVDRVASELLVKKPHAVDPVLVHVGAMLHDVGVYALYEADGRLDHANYVQHGILGHELLLRDVGLPDAVCRFCSCHTGVGLTRQDVLRQQLPLPVRDYLPATLDEELVMYADKFHSKTDPPEFLTADVYATVVRRFGDDKARRFADLVDRFGEPDVQALSRVFGHAVRSSA